MEIKVRPSPIAGQWYPAELHRLAASIDGYIQSAQLPTLDGDVVGVMAPHAGHRYSGSVAGYAFATLRGLSPEIVVVVSPMHYPYENPLLTTAHQAYATPLGEMPVDRSALQKLDDMLFNKLGYRLAQVIKDPEHSLEIELPFLQRVLDKPFKLLPVMVRDQSQYVVQALGESLAQVLEGRPAILVASTDLSHFYPQSVAHSLDKEMLRQVEAFNPQGVLEIEQQGKGFACGRGALAAVLWAARGMGANHAQVLNYATSGDITGDFSQVVGYGAAVFTRSATVGENI